MIDWIAVLRGALWITGLAVILSLISITRYEVTRTRAALPRRGRRRLFLNQLLTGPRYAILSAGFSLVALSLLLSASRLWERVLWGAVIMADAWGAVTELRACHHVARGPGDEQTRTD